MVTPATDAQGLLHSTIGAPASTTAQLPSGVVEVDGVVWVEERIAARKAARERRDFAEADRIRDELGGREIAIEDTGAGTKWKRVR